MIDDPNEVTARDKLIIIYQMRLNRARDKTLEIERFISSITDSDLRQIFEYRYLDGLKLREIGKLMNRDFSGIGKKIHMYLNFPTIPQNIC
jgi:DNA-directed RNA polymerase specialized sigma24 family protein